MKDFYNGYGWPTIPASGRVTDVDLTRQQLSAKEGEGGSADRPNGRVERGGVTTIFSNLEAEAIAFIKASPIIVGCVAWLTNFPILSALANCEWVAMVVQKEDFLRPDLGATSNHSARVRAAYNALPHRDWRGGLPGQMGSLSTNWDDGVEAVRCVGVANTEKLPAVPRMHHKFMVRLENQATPEPHPPAEEYGEIIRDGEELVPTAVWTGSYNLTYNGGKSLENALILTDPDICWSYLNEWSFIEGLSEPLDWQTPWVAPQWVIGT